MRQSRASFSALNWVLRVALYQIEQKYAGTGARNHYEINSECTDRAQRAEHAVRDSETTTIITYADDILLLTQKRGRLAGMMINLYEMLLNYCLTTAGDKVRRSR